MSKTCYKVADWNDDIVAVNVEKSTKGSGFVDGRRQAIFSHWMRYFDSWDSAHNYVINRALNRLERRKEDLAAAANAYADALAIPEQAP